METVLATIDARREQLARHPLFEDFARAQSLTELLAFAPRLGFWVGVFQDVLRVNAQRARDPELGALLQRHAREEGGHDTWFYDDVATLTGRPLGAAAVAAHASFATREPAYRLLEEALGLPSDRLRLVFLVALEGTSDAFFNTLMPHVLGHGGAQALRYFGSHHLESEKSHTLFEEAVMEPLRRMELSEAEHAQALALVDRTFAAFEDLFDAMRVPAPEALADARRSRAATG